MIDASRWEAVSRLVNSAFQTSLHVSVSSIGADGAPVVTPIGSLFLLEPGRACYLELTATGLGRRLDADPRVSILVVDSGRLLWVRALLTRRFVRLPAVRLVGRAETGTRPATEVDWARFAHRVGALWHLPGGRKLWRRRGSVREVRIEGIEAVGLGALMPPMHTGPARDPLADAPEPPHAR